MSPIREDRRDIEAIQHELLRLIREFLYEPILEMIPTEKPTRLKNSREDLIDAIRSGKISFYRGYFKGRLNSVISRELKKIGAVWDRTQGSWKVPTSKLPIDIRQAIDASADRMQRTVQKINERLYQLAPEKLNVSPRLNELLDKSLYRVDKTLTSQLSAISVKPPKLTAFGRQVFGKEYLSNMEKSIRGWTEDEIKRLREKVYERGMDGLRYDELADHILMNYKTSVQKAHFIARQETNLMISKYKELRYNDVGIKKYRWQCVMGTKEHPVRPAHRKLDGKVFRFDKPPISSDDGRRNNPGEDFNCRCVARPIVEF